MLVVDLDVGAHCHYGTGCVASEEKSGRPDFLNRAHAAPASRGRDKSEVVVAEF